MTRKQLESMKKAELIELARKSGVRVNPRMLKAELVDTIFRKLGAVTKAKGRKSRAAAGKKKAASAKKPAPPKAKKPSAPSPKKKAAAKAKRAARGPVKAKAKSRAGAAAKSRSKSAAPPPPLDEGTIRQKAIAGKYHLTTPSGTVQDIDAIEIPGGYGITRIVAMVRDPSWLLAYWEITPEKYEELRKLLRDEWDACRKILRIHDRSDGKGGYFDIDTGQDARNWYINVSPGRKYQIAIGFITPDGRFEQVAISEMVETPRGEVSDVIDDQWMAPERMYDMIFAASGGYEIHGGSAEMRELIEKRLVEEAASETVSSFGSGELKREGRPRAFRLWVATELILYGATEPDARVTIRGKEIELRGDGTFSVRFALPDGAIEIPVTAQSGDGIEERTIETNVRKKASSKEPVIR